ncbi:hypothetical protein [Rhizobium miluonense]|uniref:Uncharacterized protein n=1 Tax=Rhizobium miluonense TaxID=411945 RepID=A0A1C3V5Y7_9HYPH|nr:hypothetical protein [Rhizobium miluonense]SCB23182.1 hypothetical protein GA0061102_100939 [Rhizobium miluonense]
MTIALLREATLAVGWTITIEGKKAKLKQSQREGEFSIARLHIFGAQLLTYIRSNRGAIVN